MKDKVILNLADNPELAEYFSRKSPGDACTLEITGTLDDTANDTATLSVKEVEYEGAEGAEEEESTGEGHMMDEMKDKEAPLVAIVMGVSRPKKKSE